MAQAGCGTHNPNRRAGGSNSAAPHSVVLVLDATTGQNAVQRCGIALAETFGLPVHAVGAGEHAGDLRPFDAGEFARGLVGL